MAGLEQKAFKMVNDYIVKNNLKIPKLTNPNGIFSINDYSKSTSIISSYDGLVITPPRKDFSNYYYFQSLKNVPTEYSALVTPLRQLLEQKESVESQASSL